MTQAGGAAPPPQRLRAETARDAPALAALVEAAFRDAPHASGDEAAILARLRAAGALTLSLLAEREGVLLGQVAFSPVTIAPGTVCGAAPATTGQPETGRAATGQPATGQPAAAHAADTGWFGLGPLAVAPGWQGQGIGSALVVEGLARLRALGAAGCVVLGDPGYYGRFGFRAGPALRYPGPPPAYFQALPLAGPLPQGEVAFHAAFGD